MTLKNDFLSVRSLFYPPAVERIKTSFSRFPAKNIPVVGKRLVPLTYQCDVKENSYFLARNLFTLPLFAKPMKLLPSSLFLVVFTDAYSFQGHTKITLSISLKARVM